MPLTLFKNKLWFNAQGTNDGTELWSSDGTAAGTTSININGTGNGSNPQLIVAGTDYLYFEADDTTGVRAL